MREGAQWQSQVLSVGAQVKVRGPIAITLFLVSALFGYTFGRRIVDSERKATIIRLDSIRTILDTTYLTDTVVRRVARTRYDTVRVTDTIVRNDTVFVPRAVADSAVATCERVIVSCEARLAISDSTATFWRDSAMRAPERPSMARVAIVSALVTLIFATLAR